MAQPGDLFRVAADMRTDLRTLPKEGTLAPCPLFLPLQKELISYDKGHHLYCCAPLLGFGDAQGTAFYPHCTDGIAEAHRGEDGQNLWSPDRALRSQQIFLRLASEGVLAMMESRPRDLEAGGESVVLVPFSVGRPLPAPTGLGAALVPCPLFVRHSGEVYLKKRTVLGGFLKDD